MVEHLTFNQEVMGSSPIALTNEIKDLYAISVGHASQNCGLESLWEASRGFRLKGMPRDLSASKSKELSGRTITRLTIDHHTLHRQRGNGVADTCECLGIVDVVRAQNSHLIAVLAGDNPVSVELDLVQPAGAGGRPIGQGGLAGNDETARLGPRASQF